MSNPEFDWTEILPEPERSKVRAERHRSMEEFFDKFPTKEEVEQAGREGRAALAKASATVDARKETERLMWLVIDHIAGSLQQPADSRAWEHLLIYCPLSVLEAAYVQKAQRSS